MKKTSPRRTQPQRNMSQPRKTISGRRKQARAIAESVLEDTVDRIQSSGAITPDDADGLMTLTRAAEVLGVKHDMLWTHVRSGRLKSVPVESPRGRTVTIVRRGELRRWRDDQIVRNTQIGTPAATARSEKLRAARL